MKIVFFSAKPYDKQFFSRHNASYDFGLEFLETHLGPHIVNAVEPGTAAVCVFVNDRLTKEVIEVLAAKGVKIIALRCAGFNNVDLKAAQQAGIHVCRVPAYSPEAVAEHAVAMLLTLNRKIHKAYNRVREQNFALNGLLGFNLHGKTIGVIGMGKIGQAFCRIVKGFGCTIVAYDPYANAKLIPDVEFTSLEELLKRSDIISLHCPLTPDNHHFINATTIAQMKKGVTIVNTSRGALIDTKDAIEALKSGHIGNLAIDVYEQEENLFFRDLSAEIIPDDMIQRLMSFPNVLVTGHQAFFTVEALDQIAATTLHSVNELSNGRIPADVMVK
ncbi:2-hydroxyacid dehydrogenase [Pseudobacter ginsenosidimutans]|uniref:D-lactate dehydrogenase n=1 Tax=Pseudobacter ginsenosidimutans TaxID=661488 RepID=A0A4Q7N213_9BACT|nr:2-hydroxyacid dehydrogenase [Pseudobacter ginsenosidimutans]QEC44043.1 2-hydroxyacid dehydrogenase [Pseudobacter ginsenosidimutans]RZS75483.1 D-lactate dehydrogenase [Pseudobacter ginsenosidimutans]